MKTYIAASLIAAAALSLTACSQPASEANLAGSAETGFNESEIPAEGAEGNVGDVDAFANSAAGLDNAAVENTGIAPIDNTAAPIGNDQ